MRSRARAAGAPADYRLPRRAPWGMIGLAIVTAAAALPFLAFLLAAAIS